MRFMSFSSFGQLPVPLAAKRERTAVEAETPDYENRSIPNLPGEPPAVAIKNLL
jgi:hypothetical protein